MNMNQSKRSARPEDPNKIFDESRRDILIEQLTNDACDCMVCYEKVLRYQPIWYCRKCYSIFHLTCIHKWATSSSGDADGDSSVVPKKWRCPGCQSQNDEIPSTCRCFCGAFEYPETVGQGHMYSIPHSCGLKCNRVIIGSLCPHPCTLPCHPGPCPPCRLQVSRYCNCGKAMIIVHCGSKTNSCGFLCQEILKCGKHRCEKMCHPKSCGDCNSLVEMDCHCGKESKIVPCSTKTRSLTGKFSCGIPCADFAPNENESQSVVRPTASSNRFEKIYFRVKTYHENCEGNIPCDVKYFLCCCLPCASVFMYCLKLLSVIMGVVGLLYFGDCTMQPALPGVLIVIGLLTGLGQFLEFYARPWVVETPDSFCGKLCFIVTVLWISSFLYFYAILYKIDSSYVQRSGFYLYHGYKGYCSEDLYTFAQMASITSFFLGSFVIGFYFWSLCV